MAYCAWHCQVVLSTTRICLRHGDTTCVLGLGSMMESYHAAMLSLCSPQARCLHCLQTHCWCLQVQLPVPGFRPRPASVRNGQWRQTRPVWGHARLTWGCWAAGAAECQQCDSWQGIQQVGLQPLVSHHGTAEHNLKLQGHSKLKEAAKQPGCACFGCVACGMNYQGGAMGEPFSLSSLNQWCLLWFLMGHAIVVLLLVNANACQAFVEWRVHTVSPVVVAS